MNNNNLSPELRDEITNKASALVNARNYNNPGWNAGFHEGYETGATKYASKWEQSEERRKQAMDLLAPILEWGQSKAAEIPLGACITEVVLERAKQWQQSEAEKKVMEKEHNTLCDQRDSAYKEIVALQVQNKQLREVLKYVRETIRFEFNTEDIIAFINDKLTQLPSEGKEVENG